MAPALTAFLPASAAASGAAREAGFARAQHWHDDGGDMKKDDAYAAFHAEQLRELRLSEYVNSLCLPVYAVPLGLAPPAEAPADADKAHKKPKKQKQQQQQQQQQRRTKRGARAVRESGVKAEKPAPAVVTAAAAADADSETVEEEYTTRSGRQTKKRVVVGAEGHDDDASFNGDEEDIDMADHEIMPDASGKRKRKRKRKRSAAGGGGATTAQLRYSIAFADHVGTYPYAFEVEVPAADLAEVRVDVDGKVTNIGGREDLKVGDSLLMPPDAVGTMTPQEFLDVSMLSGRAAVFGGQRERYMSKLTGLKGVLIHPTKLYDAVKATGGFDHIVAHHLWQKVRRKLNLPNTSSSGYVLRRTYEDYFKS